jgi:hypothetical protein
MANPASPTARRPGGSSVFPADMGAAEGLEEVAATVEPAAADDDADDNAALSVGDAEPVGLAVETVDDCNFEPSERTELTAERTLS